MALIDSNFDPNNLQNFIFSNKSRYANVKIDDLYIYANPKEISFYKYFTYEDNNYDRYSLFNLINNENLTDFFNYYGTDSSFIRGINSHFNYTFNNTYFFDIKEKYYLILKKYYGFMDIYKYNQELDILTNFTKFFDLFRPIENENEYTLINNELMILNGFQLYTFTINYNSLFDFYIQKVEDFEDIQINSEIFEFYNLVKLLNANKSYHLNFTADHLVKLDNKFLDAEITFTDKENNIYYLNNISKSNRTFRRR